MTCKGTLRQVFVSLRPLPLPRFLFGMEEQFLGFEYGQKQSDKLLQNRVSNTTEHPHPLPVPLPPVERLES
jgi:hypothetical protein